MTHADYQALLAQKDRYLDLIETTTDDITKLYALSQLNGIAQRLSNLSREVQTNV